MPGFDATGPRGQGPFTGRGMGYCAMPVSPNIKPNMPVPPTPPYRPTMYSGRPRWGMRFGGRGFGRRWRY